MRRIAGILLVCAALLKAVELLGAPTAMMVNPLGRFFMPTQIGVELGLGLFVLSGLYWSKLRPLLIALFIFFASYSFYLAINGATSCGCFGPLRIHPWWTFFIDAAVVVGLAASLANHTTTHRADATYGVQAARFRVARYVVLAGATGISVVGFALVVRYVNGRTAVAKGMTAASGGLMILEPEQWIGEELPIADSISVDLTKGDWVAVLHRHDCPACQEALPRYEQLALMGQSVALIEIPPYGSSRPLGSSVRCCRLANDRDWFVETPVEIRLRNGIVASVKSDSD